MKKTRASALNRALRSANLIVSENIFEPGHTVNVKFQRTGRRSVAFQGADPVTGMTYQGEYYLGGRNAVDRYNVFYWQETLGSLYIDVLLDGSEGAFVNHTAGLEYVLKSGDPSVLGILGRAFSGNGQDLARLLDQVQGADTFNSYSTLVQSSPDQIWYA